jgi:hypothetical protein
MEMKSVPVNENMVIVIRTSADLFLSGDDLMEVRFFGSEDRLQVRKEEGMLRIENHSGMDLILPRTARVRVEKVGGSAFMQDLGMLDIQKVGGDLAMQRIGQVDINKVGGSLTVRAVNGPFTVHKVGGDFQARELSGPVTVEAAGGNIDVQAVDGESLAARAGGDLTLYLTRSLPQAVEIRAGGNCELFIPSDTSARFTFDAGNEQIEIRLSQHEPAVEQDIEQRHYEFVIGEGEGRVEMRAGGDVLLSDEAREPSSLSAEFDRLETSWHNARENRARYGWPGHFDPERSADWADMISRRAQEAARRAEQRAQSAVRRVEEHTRRTVDREVRRAGYGPGAGFDIPQPPVPPKASPVTEKERMLVLNMLQENKITVEQAESLLRALEGRYKE